MQQIQFIEVGLRKSTEQFCKKDGTYYVVEAVPETSKKTVQIVSAYINKTGAQTPVGGNPQNGPVPVTSKNATSVTPANTISQNEAGVKGDTENAADLGENTKSAEESGGDSLRSSPALQGEDEDAADALSETREGKRSAERVDRAAERSDSKKASARAEAMDDDMKVVIDVYAKAMGVDVRTVLELPDGAYGKIELAARRITLAANSRNALSTLIHEDVHLIAALDEDAYEDMREVALRYLKETGADVKALVGEKMEAHKSEISGMKPSEQRAYCEEEVVADAYGAIQNAPNASERIARVLSSLGYTETEAKTLRDKIVGIFTKLRDAFRRLLDALRSRNGGDTVAASKAEAWINSSIEACDAMLDAWSDAHYAIDDARRAGRLDGVKVEGERRQAKPSEKDPSKLDKRTVTREDVKIMLENAEKGEYDLGTYLPVRITTPSKLIYWAYAKRGEVIDNNPIVMPVKKVIQALSREGIDPETGRAHNMTVNELISVIENMNEPRYIVYQSSNDRYVEVVPYEREDGRSKAFAVIQIGDDYNAEYLNGYEGGLYSTLVTSFEPDAGKLNELLRYKKNTVIYDAKKDVSRRSSGSLVPSLSNDTPFFEDSVTQPGENVKSQKANDVDEV